MGNIFNLASQFAGISEIAGSKSGLVNSCNVTKKIIMCNSCESLSIDGEILIFASHFSFCSRILGINGLTWYQMLAVSYPFRLIYRFDWKLNRIWMQQKVLWKLFQFLKETFGEFQQKWGKNGEMIPIESCNCNK